MKVLFCIRKDYYSNFAGDSMQLIKMAEYLKSKHIDVEINNGNIVDFNSYDLIHLFNLTRIGDTYKYYKLAKKYKKKIVISPIYWDLTKYYKNINDKKSLMLWNKLDKYRFKILNDCSAIYPNSNLEGELLYKDFNINTSYTTVYNGTEFENKSFPLYEFKKRYNLKDFVLCVGRICERKNQLSLCKICNKLNQNVLLIGNINNKKYFNECIKYNNVSYLKFMDKYNLFNAYKAAKIHVLPSFVETPGLTSLDAAAIGCNIISTDQGSATEYFKNNIFYCNPYDEKTIEDSLVKGLNNTKQNTLKDYVTYNYSWDRCLKKLYQSYMTIL